MRVETKRIDLYEKVELLKNGETVVGTVLIKSEEMVTNSDGKVIAKPVRREGELLVTLTGANMQFFADVSDEMLLREIVIMDVGEVKRAPSPQYHYGTDVLNGNKFFPA